MSHSAWRYGLGALALSVALPATAMAQSGGAAADESGSEPELEPAAPTRRAAPTVAPLTPEAQARIGVAEGAVGDWTDPDRLVHRTLIPPFLLLERSANRRTTVVFPFFFRDRRGDATSMLIPPYYRYRSPTASTDVVFPFYGRWRGARDEGGTYATDIVPPVYVHRWQGRGEAHGHALGVAPLFFYGDTFAQDGSLEREHLIIPPLLTVHTWRPEHAFTLAGPFFYDRLRADTDWGLAPLVFGGNDLRGNYLLIPPLLTYHHENHDENSAITVVGPFWTTSSPDSFSVNLAPVFFHHHDATSNRTTLAPLFHYDHGEYGTTLVTPLFGYSRRGETSTLITPLYQQHRGATNWDAVAPFFFSFRQPDIGAHTEAFFPLFYHRRTQRSNTWWVLPTIHTHTEGPDWYTNVYPIFYTGRSGPRTHTVVAPFFWDFKNEETGSRATVLAPVFWRFASPTSETMLVGNFLWMSALREGVRSYEWHLLPLFSYARPRPEDVSWNVLFGLTGYRRSGTHRQMRLFWIPIDL